MKKKFIYNFHINNKLSEEALMKNKIFDIQGLYRIIKHGYLEMFPYPFKNRRDVAMKSLESYLNNEYALPVNISLSDEYKNINFPKFVQATTKNEELVKLSSESQESIINIVSDYNAEMENIIDDLDHLHNWLILEGFIIVAEQTQFKPREYHLSKIFLETETLLLN
ncbi:hypothetical protein ACK1M2_000001 [Providencia rettgeri]